MGRRSRRCRDVSDAFGVFSDVGLDDDKRRDVKSDVYSCVLTALLRAKIALPIAELARITDLTEREVREALEYLEAQGFNVYNDGQLVELTRHVEAGARVKIRLEDYYDGE